MRELVDGCSVLGLNENTARDWYFSLPKNENYEVGNSLCPPSLFLRARLLEHNRGEIPAPLQRFPRRLCMCVCVCMKTKVDMEMIIAKFLERPAGLEKSAYGLDHRGYTQV